MLHDSISIAKLRLRSSLTDRIAMQQGIHRQLQGTDLTPEELPPSAVLIVRQLRDPMPGQLAASIDRVYAPKPWAGAVRDRLRDMLRDAARPRRGDTLPSAPAVLFEDKAQLLACLTLDLVRDRVSQHWWWHDIGVAFPELAKTTRSGADVGDPCVGLSENPREIPAVFACLAQWRAVIEVMAHLDPQQTEQLLQAMARAHQLDPSLTSTTDPGCREWADEGWSMGQIVLGLNSDTAASEMKDTASQKPSVIVKPYTTVTGTPDMQDTANKHSGPAPYSPAYKLNRPEEPWRPWLPAGTADQPLSPQQRCLLGIALALHCAPARVRAADFIRHGRAWWRYQSHIDASSWLSDNEDPPVHRLPKRTVDWTTDGATTQGRIEILGATPTDRQFGNTKLQDRHLPEPINGNEQHALETADSEYQTTEDASIAGDLQTPSVKTTGQNDAEPAVHSLNQVQDESLTPPEELLPDDTQMFAGQPFHTRLGGILYLIHALEDLDIPMAFEKTWGLASRLGPWGTLDLVARTLLQDRLIEVEDDGIWAVLTSLIDISEHESVLDRTPAAIPERRLQCPTAQLAWSEATPDYRAPVEWYRKLFYTSATLKWTNSQNRLWLWSCSGYLIASVRRDAQRPLEQARAESIAWLGHPPGELNRGCTDEIPLATPPERHDQESLSAWATAAIPAIVHRLRLAFDLKGDDDLLWQLISVEGNVYVTNSHIDLVADLDQVWLAARRAGLDRNPGWLPDYGRVVLFHFN